MAKTPEQAPFEEQPLLSHLVELRNRLLRSVVGVLFSFLALAYFANDIYTFLATPLLKHLPAGSTMIAIEVASPFLIPFKVTLVVALLLALPYVLYQAWAFIAPGLYTHEKRRAIPLLVASTCLFYSGMAFAYFVLFPVMFGFFSATTPVGVAMMTDIGQYFDFTLTMLLVFGICFEIPVLAIVLVWGDVIDYHQLVDKRPYVIVLAFFIGAVLTPPDPVSQTLLAVPMWLLFELGLLCARLFRGKPVDSSPEDQGSALESRE